MTNEIKKIELVDSRKECDLYSVRNKSIFDISSSRELDTIEKTGINDYTRPALIEIASKLNKKPAIKKWTKRRS